MRRVVVLVTVCSLFLAMSQPIWAQDFGPYGSPQTFAQPQYGVPVQYGAPAIPVQTEQYPILKRLLIGAGILGAGYALGRATAPQYGPSYNVVQPPQIQGPVFRPGSWNHHPVHAFNHGPVHGGPMHGPMNGPGNNHSPQGNWSRHR
ncbi:MAG: hypothetical protein K8T89_20140 [Planctomycetes bacterium]|nr:hypothetical protein [Planctomycetota bacterium]